VNQGKGGTRRRSLWPFWVAAVAVLVAGYLFLNRSGNLELVPGGVIASRVPAGQSGNSHPPFPTAKPGSSSLPPGFKIIEQKVVELNSATIAEIETLPGITPDYARKIIAGRPYQSMADLARTGIPRAILDEISPPAVLRVTRGGLPPPTSTEKPK
jgi:hypothetical protein